MRGRRYFLLLLIYWPVRKDAGAGSFRAKDHAASTGKNTADSAPGRPVLHHWEATASAPGREACAWFALGDALDLI